MLYQQNDKNNLNCLKKDYTFQHYDEVDKKHVFICKKYKTEMTKLRKVIHRVPA